MHSLIGIKMTRKQTRFEIGFNLRIVRLVTDVKKYVKPRNFYRTHGCLFTSFFQLISLIQNDHQTVYFFE